MSRGRMLSRAADKWCALRSSHPLRLLLLVTRSARCIMRTRSRKEQLLIRAVALPCCHSGAAEEGGKG